MTWGTIGVNHDVTVGFPDDRMCGEKDGLAIMASTLRVTTSIRKPTDIMCLSFDRLFILSLSFYDISKVSRLAMKANTDSLEPLPCR